MTTEAPARGLKKERVGKVVSDKMKSTAVVEIERLFSHPVYKKYIRRSKRYYAHDEGNQCHVGDTVRIVETRPISKTKHWRIAEIITKAK